MINVKNMVECSFIIGRLFLSCWVFPTILDHRYYGFYIWSSKKDIQLKNAELNQLEYFYVPGEQKFSNAHNIFGF